MWGLLLSTTPMGSGVRFIENSLSTYQGCGKHWQCAAHRFHPQDWIVWYGRQTRRTIWSTKQKPEKPSTLREEQGGWDGEKVVGGNVSGQSCKRWWEVGQRGCKWVRISKPVGSCWRVLRIPLFKDTLFCCRCPSCHRYEASFQWTSLLWCYGGLGDGEGALESASLDAALHDPQDSMSWSPCPEPCVSHLNHQRIWGQMSSETRGFPKALGRGLPGRLAPWQRQASWEWAPGKFCERPNVPQTNMGIFPKHIARQTVNLVSAKPTLEWKTNAFEI